MIDHILPEPAEGNIPQSNLQKKMTTAASIQAIRAFNRFYTNQAGLLQESLLQSDFSLTEGRVLFELGHGSCTTATELRRTLHLDAGYLSRIIRRLNKLGLLEKKKSETDGRQTLLALSNKGQQVFKALEHEAAQDALRLLEKAPAEGKQRIIAAMHTIQELLDERKPDAVPYLLRPHQPGDIGWVIQRHAELYNREYGWTIAFEGLVAEIAGAFIANYNATKERCWIAERDGSRAGCVFLIQHPTRKNMAKLRMLLVEPAARGLGIGKRLVQECERFARQVGYEGIELWTNDILHAARHIYKDEGYRLIHEEEHHNFGHDLIGQTWELLFKDKMVE